MQEPNASFDGHEQFPELCALYSTGTLSQDEITALREHLLGCLECRDRLADYQQIVREGVPLLAEGRAEYHGGFKSTFSMEDSKRALYVELDRQQLRITNHPLRLTPQANHCSEAVRQHDLLLVRRSHLIEIAAMIVLFMGFVFAAMVWRATHAKPNGRPPKTISQTADGHEFTALVVERDSLSAELKQRDAKLKGLATRIDAQLKEISRLKEMSDRYRSENEQIKSQLTFTQTENSAIKESQSPLEAQLTRAQDSVLSLRKELGDTEWQRRNDLLRSASLETRIAQLSTQVKDQQSTIDEQQSMLASDRDIRELMGARNLYIADVFDVDPNSHTKKAFGRVFYTKHKSLIFYAFDLEQRHGMKNASAFQAWGLGDLDKKHPLNLGIFYLDNQANRRWVLKFEDANVLAKINSVFVTIEPQGGSTKPSGRQLLYAYLSNQPNHP
jgi:uncharacterized protein YhaN